MGEKSGIQWTDNTFSPWHGCTKIPQVDGKPSACDFCYAERDSHRWGFDLWGKDADRRVMGEHTWNNPRRWNKKAEKAGVRTKVFCASMSDVFEDRRDLDEHRERLWKLIEETPHLDWQLLTKRPALMTKFAPWKTWPDNVWAGTTTENQHWADHRLEHLAKVPARIRFISAEPIFEPIDIRKWLPMLSWVITGGESGPHARPADIAWVKSLRDQCVEAGVPFFFKQWTKAGSIDHAPMLDGRLWREFPAPVAPTSEMRAGVPS